MMVKDVAIAPTVVGGGAVGRLEIVDITPEVAGEWLAKNHPKNRNFNQANIEKYAGDMMTGAWRDADMMYTLREDGVLLDGQNRLRAIILAGYTQQAIVRYVDNAMEPKDLRVDIGGPRSAMFLLGLGSHHIGAARYLARVATRRTGGRISIDEAGRIAERIDHEFKRISGTTRRGFSVAPVVSAVAFSMWRYPASSHDISTQYHAVVNHEYGSEVWPAFQSASRYILSTSSAGRRNDPIDSFCRITRALEPENRSNTRVQFKDLEAYRRKLEPLVAQYIGLPSTLPPVERA